MRKYKYTKETLDVALEELQSENVVQRKKCINFISMASRSELFGKTCDTLSVQTWFLSSENREKLIRVLHQETEEKLLWEYLLILLMVCERYIDHGCYAKDFAKESSCVEFKQRAYEIAKQYAHHSSAIVRQMSGSIIGYMGDNDVWDIRWKPISLWMPQALAICLRCLLHTLLLGMGNTRSPPASPL